MSLLRSCEYCRSHKIKCLWETSATTCNQCLKRNQPCRRRQTVRQRRTPVHGSRRDAISGDSLSSLSPTTGQDGFGRLSTHALEARLAKLEARLVFSDGTTALRSSAANVPNTASIEVQRAEPSAGPGRLRDPFLPHYGEMIAPEKDPMDLSSSLLPDNSFALTHILPQMDLVPLDIPLSRLDGLDNGQCYLPPAKEASALLAEYLHDCNTKIPLIAPQYITRHVSDCYTGKADGSPISWVLTYMIFGMAHRQRAMSLFIAPDDTSRSHWYLDKCLETLPRLLMQEPSLRLVQALLGVSILLQTSSRYKRATLFVSTAMHMVQGLGYHDAEMMSTSDLEQKEQQYVFWITFLTDTDMSFASMRQCKQSLAEISTPLPHIRDGDWWARGEVQNESELNIFALHSKFAILQAGILERLFSVKSRQLSDAVLESAYHEALDQLAQWRSSHWAFNLSVQNLYQSLYRSDIVHLVCIETAYFRTIFQLRAAYLLGSFRKRLDVFSIKTLRTVAEAEDYGYPEDARRVLELTALVSGRDTSVAWISIYSSLAAMVTLLGSHDRRQRCAISQTQREMLNEEKVLCDEALSSVVRAVKQLEDSGLTESTTFCQALLEQASVCRQP